MAQLIITVVDEGTGIADAKLDKIYAAFQKSGAAAAYNFKDVGVGLSVSYALVTLMGGSISVQSEQGKGTVFSFTVALERVE